MNIWCSSQQQILLLKEQFVLRGQKTLMAHGKLIHRQSFHLKNKLKTRPCIMKQQIRPGFFLQIILVWIRMASILMPFGFTGQKIWTIGIHSTRQLLLTDRIVNGHVDVSDYHQWSDLKTGLRFFTMPPEETVSAIWGVVLALRGWSCHFYLRNNPICVRGIFSAAV